jgi:hypothetical protein
LACKALGRTFLGAVTSFATIAAITRTSVEALAARRTFKILSPLARLPMLAAFTILASVETLAPILVALRPKPIAPAAAAIAAEALSLRFVLESLRLAFAADFRRLVAGLVSLRLVGGFGFDTLGAFILSFVIELLRKAIGLLWLRRRRRLHGAHEAEIMLSMLLIVFRLDAIAR